MVVDIETLSCARVQARPMSKPRRLRPIKFYLEIEVLPRPVLIVCNSIDQFIILFIQFPTNVPIARHRQLLHRLR